VCQDAGKKLEIRGVGRKTFREGPTGESKIEQAKTLALSGGKECDWSTLAARIARDSPEKYGASHPLGPISRRALLFRTWPETAEKSIWEDVKPYMKIP